MKNFIATLVLSVNISVLFCQDAFITLWDMTLPSSSPTSITLNISTTGPVEYEWEEISPGNAVGSGTFIAGNNVIQSLPSTSIIQFTIQPENLMKITFEGHKRLIDLEQWGTAEWTSFSNSFKGCSNMNISASDIPNLTNVSDMSSMFEGCSTMTGPYNINEWNTSMVTNMSSLFKGATQFNQDIGSWNTSNVTDMSFMFMLANTFNQNIENWDVSNVTNMYEMFCMMDSFNQPLNGWDVSSVYDMSYMFAECHAFNQNIGNWTLKNNVQLLSFFNNCGLDCDNYSNTLIGWSINNPTVQNRTLYANQLEYGIDGQAARTFLIFNRGWLILGDYLSQTDCSNQQLSINSDNALLNIYPNPVTDILTIQLEKPSEIKIFSSAGTLIYDGFENAVLSFDMSPLSTGIYFIHINNKVYKISKI